LKPVKGEPSPTPKNFPPSKTPSLKLKSKKNFSWKNFFLNATQIVMRLILEGGNLKNLTFFLALNPEDDKSLDLWVYRRIYGSIFLDFAKVSVK
jgi:hypothetical protein